MDTIQSYQLLERSLACYLYSDNEEDASLLPVSHNFFMPMHFWVYLKIEPIGS